MSNLFPEKLRQRLATLKASALAHLRAVWPFLAVFTAVSLMDLLLQREARSRFEDYLSDPYLYLEAIGISIKWGLLLTAPALLLGRRARIPYLVLWPYLALIETVEAVARFAYGMSLDGDWLMIVCASSASEMREFFGQFSWPGIAITAVCLAAVMFAGLAFFHRRQYPATSKFSIGMGALLCTPFVLFNLILSSPICAGNEMMFTFLPLDTIHNYALYSDIARTVHSPRLPPAEAASKERIDEMLGVIAIGESATRSHWHLYGYERPTTPMMDSLRGELVVFKDVRAVHSTTGKSLRDVFTEASRDNPDETRSTFSQQCAAAGYRCALFSAQSRWGRWEGVETMLFAGCAVKHYLAEQKRSSRRVFDDALVKPVAESIQSNAPPGKIVFLHLMGSHAPPGRRYPSGRSVYPRHEGDIPPGVADSSSIKAIRANHYDNSIAYTDFVLGELLDMMKSLKRPSFFVYFSDHGETPLAPHWRDASSPDIFAVPMIVWLSPEYRARNPEVASAIESIAAKPVCLDELMRVFRILALLDPASLLGKH